MDAFIKAISYYLPKKVITNQDLVQEFPEWTVEKIAGKIGVSQRHIAAENETAGDMAVAAAENLFREHNLNKYQIDFLILCTQSPDYFLPSTACVVQHRLGLKTTCGAYDIDLGCSGYEYALATAKGFILGGIARNVLVLTSETYSKHIHPKDKGNRTIFGDGATATWVSSIGFAKLLNFTLGTDGSGFEYLIQKTGGWRNRFPVKDSHITDTGGFVSSDHLFMDGKGIFDFSSDVVPSLVSKNLKDNALSFSDVDLFVFHQANKYMMNYLRKMLGIEKERFFVYLDSVGNTVSSTIPIALVEAGKMGLLKGKIMLVGFGVGLSFGATVIDII